MERVRPLFVWGVWAAATAFAGWFIARYGGRVPMIDDFGYIGFRLDPAFPSAATLWAQLNEHRLPLPRLVSWFTARLFGLGLKTQMAVDLALVAGLTAALLVTVRRLRGSTQFSDAFLPLVLLSVGQWENLLWAVQVNFFVPLVLQGIVLILLAGLRDRLGVRQAWGLALVTLLLPLCGIQGVVTAAPLAVWLIYAGWASGRNWVAVAGGVAVLALIGVYFIGYASPPHHERPRVNAAAVRYAIRVIGGGWGPVAEELGPAEPTRWPPLLGLLTLGLLAVSAGRVLMAARRAEDRLAALGLLTFPIGLLVLAGGIASGRAGMAGGVLANRYVTFAIPLLLWMYLVWVRFGPPLSARLVTEGLFLLAVLVAWPNTSVGIHTARDQFTEHTLIERDVLLGVPPSALAEHHGWFLFPSEPSVVPPSLEALKARGVSPFTRMAAERPLVEVPAKWHATAAAPAADPEGWYRADARQLILFTIHVEPARPCTALRLRYSLVGDRTIVASEAHWRGVRSDGTPLDRALRLPFSEAGTGRSKLLWLGEGVQAVTFILRGPGAVRIEGVTAYAVEE